MASPAMMSWLSSPNMDTSMDWSTYMIRFRKPNTRWSMFQSTVPPKKEKPLRTRSRREMVRCQEWPPCWSTLTVEKRGNVTTTYNNQPFGGKNGLKPTHLARKKENRQTEFATWARWDRQSISRLGNKECVWNHDPNVFMYTKNIYIICNQQ